MNVWIARRLYCHLLALYPEPFRREFGDEMMSMFEEYRSTQNVLLLLIDVLVSVAKQRIHNFENPDSKNSAFSTFIGCSSKLPQLFAALILGAELTAGALVGGPATPHTHAVVRPEVLVWSQTAGWGRYCFTNPNSAATAENANVTAVLVAIKREAPESWRIVRIACGHDRFVEPPVRKNKDDANSATAGTRKEKCL